MDPEVRQRARALARLLDGVVHREPTSERGAADDDLRWASSALLACWLQSSSIFKEPLREDEARGLLAPGRYDTLKAAGHIRVVLGRVEPPWLRAVERLSAADKDDIKTLRAAYGEPERQALWIEDREARAAHARHMACHQATPVWSDVAKPAFLEPRRRGEVDGFILHLDGSNWLHDVLDVAAAKLWSALLEAYSGADTDALRSWIERLESLDVILRAPTHMSRASKGRLLDAAIETLRSDSNNGDLTEELAVLDGAASPTIAGAHTCASLHMLWSDQRREIYDERRAVLSALVGVVVEHEEPLDAFSSDGRRLFALHDLALQKPHLVFELSLRVRFSRPSAIAWLLTRARSAAFALLLLSELNLQEQTTMDDGETRRARTHGRFRMVLEDALHLFCRTVALAQLETDAQDVLIASVLDVLRGFSRKKVSSARGRAMGLFGRGLVQESELFELTVSTIFETRTAGRHVLSGRPDYVALLVAELADRLVADAPSRFSQRETCARLELDAALLRFFREHASAFAARAPDTIMMLTHAVVARMHSTYLETLDLDAKDESFRFLFRDPALVRIPWADFAWAAFAGAAFKAWLRLPSLRAKLLSSSDADPRARDAVLAGCVARLRVHLEVLLRAHQETVSQVFAPDIRDGIRDALETAIGELVLASTDLTAGTADLFDEEASYSHDDSLSSLVATTVDSLVRFTTERRDRILSDWIAKTNHPSVLLTIEKGAPSLSIERLAANKLAAQVVLDEADGGAIVQVFEVVERAAAAGHEALVERLLSRGERVTKTHPWRSDWDERAFRARLLLLYKKKDRRGILDLALPPSASGDPPKNRAQRETLDESRRFYLALHDLEHDPEAAHTSFADQLVRDPSSAALLTNLFVAKLRLAKEMNDAAQRRTAYADALRWWDQTARHAAPTLAIDPVALTNELFALDGAELDEEFDRRWGRLDDVTQGHVSILKVRLQNLKRRGMPDEVERLRARAQRRHGESVLDVLGVEPPSPESISARQPSRDDYQRLWSGFCVLPAGDQSAILGYPSLQDYLLQVHLNACDHLVRGFETILALGDENRANDIVVSFVGMQIALHGWSVGPSRGGLADTERAAAEHEPGNRDWTISHHLQEIAIGEAMRLKSVEKDYIRRHVKKLVERYNPTGARAGFVLAYFEGKDFGRFADAYREEVKTIETVGALDVSVGWSELGKTKIRAFRVHVRVPNEEPTSHDHILVHLPGRRPRRRMRRSRPSTTRTAAPATTVAEDST